MADKKTDDARVVGIPAEWVLVPIKPTQPMIAAAQMAAAVGCADTGIWAAMIQAAPDYASNVLQQPDPSTAAAKDARVAGGSTSPGERGLDSLGVGPIVAELREYHGEDGHRAADEIERLQREVERLRLLRFAPEGDNHHNALACPYCNPKRLKFADDAPVVALPPNGFAAGVAEARRVVEMRACSSSFALMNATDYVRGIEAGVATALAAIDNMMKPESPPKMDEHDCIWRKQYGELADEIAKVIDRQPKVGEPKA